MMPGLMVLAMLTPLRYVPFELEGFSLMIALMNSWQFCSILSDEKLTRPNYA